MSYVWLLDETIEYYKNNKRAIFYNNETKCCYYYYDGLMCAVGRCLVDAKQFDSKLLPVKHLFIIYGKDILKEQYRQVPQEVWDKLQDFHDNNYYWNGNELSELGKDRYEFLKRIFSTYDML